MSERFETSGVLDSVGGSQAPDKNKFPLILDCSRLPNGDPKVKLLVSKYHKLSLVTSKIRQKYKLPVNEAISYSHGQSVLNGDQTMGVLLERHRNHRGELELIVLPFEAMGAF